MTFMLTIAALLNVVTLYSYLQCVHHEHWRCDKRPPFVLEGLKLNNIWSKTGVYRMHIQSRQHNSKAGMECVQVLKDISAAQLRGRSSARRTP